MIEINKRIKLEEKKILKHLIKRKKIEDIIKKKKEKKRSILYE